MASTLVGALRVVLSADSAEFKTGLADATKATTQFTGQLSGISAQVTSFGKSIATMFTIGAITAAASKVLDYASHIQDLAEQTGLTTDAIQQMDYAAKQTGSSLEAFTNAAFKLGVNLSDGTNKVQAATSELGLSYEALRQMSPDEQFNAITTALGNVEDAQKRNELGVTLMGKAYKSVATAISEGYAQLAHDAGISGADQIKQLEALGDEWDKFKSRVMVIGVQIGGSFAKSTNSLFAALKQDLDLINNSTIGTLKQSFSDWGAILGKAGEAPQVLGKAMRDLPAPLHAVTMSLEDQEKAAKSLDAQVAASIETNKAAAAAAEKFADALRHIGGGDAIAGAREITRELEAIGGPLKVLPSELKHLQQGLLDGAEAARLVGNVNLAEKFERLAKTIDPITVFQERYNVKLGDYVGIAQSATVATDDLWEQFFRLSGQVQTIGPILENKMRLPWVRFKDAVTENGPAVAHSFENISDAVKNMGNTILQAVQGGGNVLSSIGSSMGMSIGKDLATNFGGFLRGNLGKYLGDAVGAVLPGIGALLGPALSALGGGLKKLFGIGINDDIKTANTEIEKLRQNLIATNGPLDVLEAKANAVGLSFAENWGQQGKAGLDAFQKLVNEFNQRWAELEAKREKLNSDLKETQGELDTLVGKGKDLGFEFNQSGELVGVSFDAVKAKADEFGVSIEGLGPKFRQQQIDADAGKIINAFTLLEKAGGDVGGILVGMKDEIGHVVSDSIKFGTTIPKNMEPWIKNLIDTGQLTDDNGKKITNLSQIKFGDPVKTEFEKISSALLEVVNKLNNILSQIALIPTNKTMTVTAQYNDPGPPPGWGEGGGNNGNSGEDPGHAIGTMGRYGSWFKNFGAGLSTSLHGIEAVVTQPQSVPFAMDVLSGLGGGTPAMAGDGALLAEIQGLRRDMLTTIPAIAEVSARHGSQTSGRRR